MEAHCREIQMELNLYGVNPYLIILYKGAEAGNNVANDLDSYAL